MNIQMLSVAELHPYFRNPRRNEASVQFVANSIREFGFKVPIVVDKDYVIVTGHTRWKAAQQLEIDKVPVIVADDLTPEQIKAFRLADNKVGERSEWDEELLDKELAEILDIDMSAFDFDVVVDDGFGEDFELKSGDKDTTITMSFTFSDDEAEIINEAISEMKRSQTFKDYENPTNMNSNGNALFLVVEEWLRQRT